MSLFSELKRRNVFRVAIAYVALAWIMAQVAELLLEAFAAPDWVLKSLLALFVIGFPFAVFFSWAFELTPEGVRRERDVDRGESITEKTGRRLDRAIIVLLVLALGAFAWDRFSPRDAAAPSDPVGSEAEVAVDASAEPTAGTRAPSEQSIAVLPFANMSEDPNNEYFSDGIAEEILNLLARLPDLHVTSRSSAFQFKGDDIHIPTVAGQLGVAHVLEGSVRKAGNRVRVTAQLIDADADRHLWSDTWDRELTDIFAIQDEIAGAVVEALQTKLLGTVQTADLSASQRTDPRAYEHYLRARHLTWQRLMEPLLEAERLFGQAIEIDPAYAPAYAGLAIALYFQTNAGPVDELETVARAEAAIERALELDEENSDAHAVLGLIRGDQGRYEEAHAALEKAVELNPNDARALTWQSSLYQVSDPVKGLQLARKAYEIDPLARIVVAGLAYRSRPLGLHNEVMDQARKFHELFPDSNWAFRIAADSYFDRGRLDIAVKSLYRAYRSQPDSAYGYMNIPTVLHMLGQVDLAGEWLEVLQQVAPGWPVMAFQAVEHSALKGDTDRGIQIAEAAAGTSDEPWFDEALAVAHMLNQDFASARRVLEAARPGFAREPPEWDAQSWYSPVNYATTLLRTNDEPRAQSLLAEVRDLIESQLEDGVVWVGIDSMHEALARILTLLGRPEEGLEALRTAASQGGAMCIYCWYIYAEYEGLRDLPGFQSLVDQQEAKLDAQLEQLREEGMLLTPAEVLALEEFDFDPLGEQPGL